MFHAEKPYPATSFMFLSELRPVVASGIVSYMEIARSKDLSADSNLPVNICESAREEKDWAASSLFPCCSAISSICVASSLAFQRLARIKVVK